MRWLSTVRPECEVREVQYWGHGKWGEARIGADVLSERALLQGHPLGDELAAARARLGTSAAWWFRTCETFGAARGQSFARAWADYWSCRAAGHTYVIGHWQSGLHSLSPGESATWSPEEGLAAGTSADPRRAISSGPLLPNTVTCWRTELPDGY
jgi:hypothetical protein